MSRVVKRLVKILLITTLVVVVLLFAGVWYLNHWLKSPATHARVERELSKAVKLPLKFDSLTLSLWGGLEARGVSVPDKKGNFFEAPAFKAKHRLRSLIAGRFIFEEITVDAPKFVIHQKPDGTWAAPELPKDPNAARDAEKKKPEPPKDPNAPKPAPKPRKESDVVIEKIRIRDASVEMIDKDGKPFASAQGVRIVLNDAREEKIEGHVSASRVVLHGWLAISNFSAGVSKSEEKGLIIPEFTASVGGGRAAGGYSRKDGKPKSRYNGKIKIENVDVTRAALDGGAPPPNLMGTLSATAVIRGTNDNTKELGGDITLKFSKGTCHEIETVREIGEALRMEDAAEFGIPEATATISIWNGRLTVKQLDISAPPLALTAAGTAKLDGKLELAAKLIASGEFLAKQTVIANQFGPPDEQGRRSLAFEVNGSFNKPRNNLKERITGRKSKNEQTGVLIGAAIEAAFPKPGDKKDKKPEDSGPETKQEK